MLKKTLSIAMMVMLFGFATQTFAQDKKDDGFRIVENIKGTEITSEIDFATSAVDYGYKNNSALSLLQAAEIFAKYPTSSLAIYDENGKPIETEAPAYSFDPNDLLKDAKYMAKDDANLLGCIEKTELALKEKTKGETLAGVSTATVKLRAGKKKEVVFDVSYGLYRAEVTSNSNYSDLRLSAYSIGGPKEDIQQGTKPSIWFLIGFAKRVTVVIENMDDYDTSVTLQLVSIIDPEAIEKYTR